MDIKPIYTLAFAMLLFACGTKKEGNVKEDMSVVITINNAMPHCGGAAPLPDDVWPKMELYVGCNLFVFNANEDGSRGKQVAAFITSDAGRADLNLPKGKYQLWSANKLEAFERFVEIETETQGTNYSYRDEGCFKEWYNKADFEFEVGEKKEFDFAYKNRCFIGSHPCMIYSGPYPP